MRPLSRRSKILAGLFVLAIVIAGSALALHKPEARQTWPLITTPRQAPPSPDGIALAAADAAAPRVASSSTAWGGARNGSEPTLSDRVVRYQIAATLDPVRHTVVGQEQLTWRNRSDRPVRALYLHLYLNAFEGSDSTFMSEERNLHFSFRSAVERKEGEWGHITLSGVRQGETEVPWYFVHPDGGPQSDHTVVRFDLPVEVAPGASTTVAIGFSEQLPRVVARTGYFGTFHLVGQWFPKVGVLELPGERGATEMRWNVHAFHLHSEFYADFGEYDVKLTVPSDYVLGATGVQSEPVQTSDGLSTWHFHQADVHDFAWTADRRTAKPLEAEYAGEDGRRVKVTVLFPPEYQVCAQPVLQATLDSLAFFSRTLGPYPYDSVTAVIPPFNATEAGGMEYPTFFTADGCEHAEPGTLDRAALDFVTIHEFGHGYFYGILASNEFEEPMLDEGLNQYWDMRMMRARKQPLDIATPVSKRLGLSARLPWFDVDRLGAMRSDPSDPLGANSWDRYSSAGFGSVYSRTSTTMRDLEEAVGHPALEAAFKAYYQRWKFRHPDAADLRAVLADIPDKRAVVEAIFDQQVYSTAKIVDVVDSFSSDEELLQPGTWQSGGRWVERSEDQADSANEQIRKDWNKAHPDAKKGTGPFAYRTTVMLRHQGLAVPQDVVVHFVDGSTEKFVWDSPARWQRCVWLKPVQAVSVEIDPSGKNSLDASVIAHTRTIEADHHLSRRLAGDASAVLETLFAMVADL